MKPIIYIEPQKKKNGYKTLKADLEFHNGLEKLIRKGIFRDKRDATKKLTPLLNPVLWKIKISKPTTKTRIIDLNNKRRKIELEFQ